MSYNINKTGVVEEVRKDLSQMVTEALRTASPDEHDDVKLIGQIAHVRLKDAEDDALVEFQAYGSDLPSAGNSVMHFNMNIRRIRNKPVEQPKAEPWDPSQGPLKVE